MRLPDNLQKIQQAEFIVSAKGEKKSHQLIWWNAMAVLHDSSRELRPSQDCIRVHGACVLSELNRLFAFGPLFEVNKVVCTESEFVGIQLVDESVEVFYLLDLRHRVERSFARVESPGRRYAPEAG